jgi:hypothetical protein
VASGSRDGSIALLNVHSGSTMQLLPMAHFTERRGLLERVAGGLGGSRGGGGGGGAAGSSSGGRRPGQDSGEGGGVPLWRPLPAGAAAAAVADLAACGEGLVSVGSDGSVRFHGLSHLLEHWATDPSCHC